MRVGIFDHFGWAVAVTASDGGEVVDRRRIALVEPGMSEAPVHYGGRRLDPPGVRALVERVRASAVRATSAALDELATALSEPVVSISLRELPAGFPEDVADQLRAPHESRADAVMYRRILAEQAASRGWEVRFYAARDVIGRAAALLGDRADEVMLGPRARLGPPWTRDHRTALAATIVAAAGR